MIPTPPSLAPMLLPLLLLLLLLLKLLPERLPLTLLGTTILTLLRALPRTAGRLKALGGGAAALEIALELPVLPAVVLFGLVVSYQGVRIARSVHLVNIATEETRAAYTAISNTIIGVVLLATGVFGVLGALAGVQSVVWVLFAMSFFGGLMGFTLKD